MIQTMKNTIRQRALLVGQFAILAAQLLALGFVAIGQANDVTGMNVAAEGPETSNGSADYREEVQASARDAASATQLNAMSDLDLKLDNSQPSSVQLAGNFKSIRG